jgi:hypothetical protein
MSRWPSVRAGDVLAALQRIGWTTNATAEDRSVPKYLSQLTVLFRVQFYRVVPIAMELVSPEPD